ncbi:MAG TPA: hypothetical protein VIF33_04805, partial [Casimicrobiaceae bacterium]
MLKRGADWSLHRGQQRLHHRGIPPSNAVKSTSRGNATTLVVLAVATSGICEFAFGIHYLVNFHANV